MALELRPFLFEVGQSWVGLPPEDYFPEFGTAPIDLGAVFAVLKFCPPERRARRNTALPPKQEGQPQRWPCRPKPASDPVLSMQSVARLEPFDWRFGAAPFLRDLARVPLAGAIARHEHRCATAEEACGLSWTGAQGG